MKKIFLPVIACILSLTLILSGCGSDKGMHSKLADTSDLTFSGYTDLTVILDGATLDKETLTKNGSVVVSKEIDGVTCYGVFNVLEGAFKLGLESVKSIKPIANTEIGDSFIVEYEKDGKTLCKIVRDNGTVVYEGIDSAEFLGSQKLKKEYYEAWSFYRDGFENFEVLKIKDSKTSVNYSVSNGIGKQFITENYIWGGEYSKELVNFVFKTQPLENGNIQYIVFNQKGKVVSNYEINLNNVNDMVSVGKSLVVQYLHPVDAYSSNFDVVIEGAKYNLETKKIDLKTGKGKTIGGFKYLLDSDKTQTINEETLKVAVTKIENKMPAYKTYAYLTEDGKSTETTFFYTKIVPIKENLILAETDEGVGSTLHLMDGNEKIIVDLSSFKTDYDYVAHSDKFIILKDETSGKYGMIDTEGNMITNFVYDGSEGVVNDVWFAYKNEYNETEESTNKISYTVDLNGAEAKQVETLYNKEDVITSNSFQERGITSITCKNGCLAEVKENGTEAGRSTYSLYLYSDLATAIKEFKNVDEFTIETLEVGVHTKAILIIASDGTVGVVR